MPDLDGVFKFGADVGDSVRVIDFNHRTARVTGFALVKYRGGSGTTL
jgi:hypothetical protein